VTKGTNGYPTYVFHPLRTVTLNEAQNLPDPSSWVMAEEVIAADETNLLAKPFQPLTNLAAVASARYTRITIMATNVHQKLMTGIWNDQDGTYEPYKKGNKYWLQSNETPAATEQLQSLITQVQKALPGVFNLTNQLSMVLSNTATLTSNLNVVAVNARPALSNLTETLADLNQPGALGRWLFPTTVVDKLEGTLGAAAVSLTNANTNLTLLASNLNRSLDNLADMTGNLNEQVISNPTLLRGISDAVVHADQFVQGLKRFWLFRHLFPAPPSGPSSESTTNSPSANPPKQLRSPKAEGS
jgi:hypothetical protein